jgi:hypothetical protein
MVFSKIEKVITCLTLCVHILFFSFHFKMLNLPQRYITEFQIRSMEGDIQLFAVSEIEQLVQFIRSYGIDAIAKVSFYIRNDAEPTAFHNLILRNYGCNGSNAEAVTFVPEFCEGHEEEDWELVRKALQYGNLDEMFVQYIQMPFAEV